MTITFEANVKRLFRPGDISCMLVYGVKLDTLGPPGWGASLIT
jgi:hypothetical protein